MDGLGSCSRGHEEVVLVNLEEVTGGHGKVIEAAIELPGPCLHEVAVLPVDDPLNILEAHVPLNGLAEVDDSLLPFVEDDDVNLWDIPQGFVDGEADVHSAHDDGDVSPLFHPPGHVEGVKTLVGVAGDPHHFRLLFLQRGPKILFQAVRRAQHLVRGVDVMPPLQQHGPEGGQPQGIPVSFGAEPGIWLSQ